MDLTTARDNVATMAGTPKIAHKYYGDKKAIKKSRDQGTTMRLMFLTNFFPQWNRHTIK